MKELREEQMITPIMRRLHFSLLYFEPCFFKMVPENCLI